MSPETLLLLDGWQHRRIESGHWQGWLAQTVTDAGWTVAYPSLPDPENPHLDRWRTTVEAWLRLLPGTTVIAHGLSALAWMRWAGTALDAPRPSRVLLVAPPAAGDHGGDVAAQFPTATPAHLRNSAAEPPLLVHDPADPWCAPGAGTLYAEPLELATATVPGGGHLNAATGFGPWPAVWSWVRTNSWPGQGPSDELTTAHRPSGRRLGIALAGRIPAELVAHAEQLLTITGHRPLRRLATLRPRHGENLARTEDVTDFVRRYGHEYTALVVSAELNSSSLAHACRSEGVRLVTTGPTPEPEIHAETIPAN